MGLVLRLTAVALFALLISGYAYAEYGLINAPVKSRFMSLSADWFSSNGISVVYTDDTHYEITFSGSSTEASSNVLLATINPALVGRTTYSLASGKASITSVLSVLGSATYVSTTSGCEAYYLADAIGVDYCVKKCGTTSTWSCISTSCTTYNQQRFAEVSQNMCSSCLFRSTAESAYLSNCPSTYCFNSSPQYYFQNLKLPYAVINPYYYLEGLAGACSKCYYQNRTTPCPASCTESQCDAQNYYGAWEYYCNGNERRQHRRYYDYTCSGGSCALASQNYVDDSLVENCAYGCSAGTCNSPPACSNECTSGQIRCNGSYSQVCGNYDADSCSEWPASTSGAGNTYCSYGCSSGLCNNPPSCSNECNAGQARCNSSYSQTCGNYDADSCYEWPSSTSGSGNTYCISGCNAGTGQCVTCTSHASSACNGTDLYWYNSCGQMEEIKQDCGDSSCDAWGSNYCKNGDVYQSRTCYGKGCSTGACYSNASTEEQLVQGCNGNGCINGTCNSPPALTVSVTAYTDNIENDYLGSIVWETSVGNVSETGVYVSYISDKSDAAKTAVPLNGFNRYAAILAPKYCVSSILYARAYAVGMSGTTVYSEWKSMSLAEYCNIPAASTLKPSGSSTGLITSYSLAPMASCSNTSQSCSGDLIVFDIGGIDLAALGWEGIKLFTIGSCLDDGLLTLWCAFDVATTAGTVVAVACPADGPVADIAIISMKLAKLSKGSKLLSEIKTLTKFGETVKQITLTIDGLKYTKTGSRVVRAVELGAMKIDFAADEMRTLYKELTKWILDNGDKAVMRLRAVSSATNEMLEVVVKKGGNLDDTYKVVKRADRINVAWLDNKNGWNYIVNRQHDVHIRDALALANKDIAVKDKIIDAVKTGTRSATDSHLVAKKYQNPITKRCYLLRVILWGVSNTPIKDAYPERVRC